MSLRLYQGTGPCEEVSYGEEAIEEGAGLGVVVHIQRCFVGTLNREVNPGRFETVVTRHHEFACADDAGEIGVANRDGGQELAEIPVVVQLRPPKPGSK